MGDNGDGRTIRVGHCPISQCPANFGDEGCRCGYRMDNVECFHPVYRRRWLEAMELEAEADPDQVASNRKHVSDLPDADPQTLTARVAQAQRTGQRTTPEQARAKIEQLGLGLEV